MNMRYSLYNSTKVTWTQFAIILSLVIVSNNKTPMKIMNTPLIRPTLRGLVLALAAIVLSSFVASAHPYASGITNVGGTISFILNETADTVGVYFPDNNSTNFLGANLDRKSVV